ncbi:MAG: DUF1853 family protein [Pirellulaceae bacterium]
MNPLQIEHDFEWVLNCPTLLDSAVVHEMFGVDVLHLEPNNISAPHSELLRLAKNLRSRRVGDYFEQLSLLAVEHTPSFDVLVRHLQIHDDHRTIGEIDCIYRNQRAEIVHLEIAVKFFLFNEQLPNRILPEEMANWGILNHFIGPNPADSLAGKLQHLITRQLQLANHPSAKEHVGQSVDRKQILLKGVLHYPRVGTHTSDSATKKRSHPNPSESQAQHQHPLIAASHQQGTWIRLSELNTLHPKRNSEQQIDYRIMAKPNWLSNRMQNAKWQNYDRFAEAVTAHFASGGTALLTLLRCMSKSGSIEADERCFIVHDRWPEPAEPNSA